jgi:hypothetical protein
MVRSAAAQLDQFIDLLTGVMNDQPVTLKGDYSVVAQNLRVVFDRSDQGRLFRFSGCRCKQMGVRQGSRSKSSHLGFSVARVSLFNSHPTATLPSRQ